MIGIILQQGGSVYRIIVDGESVTFTDGHKVSDISGLSISREGVIKEFPDLKNRSDWRKEAIKRFKDKIKSLKTEDERVDYIVSDLRKHGFIPKYKQRNGFRVEVIK